MNPNPETTLCETESQVLGLISQAEGDNIWAIQCRQICGNVLKGKQEIDIRRFRNLMKELYSQYLDSPNCMKRTVGSTALHGLELWGSFAAAPSLTT